MHAMLSRVHIKNFKSIGSAVVDLGRFVVLVGPNGAGKSNFVDALRFVADSLTHSVEFALQSRGGIMAVRRKSRGHPQNFGFRLFLTLASGAAEYSFEIVAEKHGRFSIKRERCINGFAQFEVSNGELTTKGVAGVRNRIESDRLALTILSGIEEFRPVYDAITSFRFYALLPDRIRELQEPDRGEVLKPDGSNSAAVLREIRQRDRLRYDRLCNYLGSVVPGIEAVSYATAGPKETLEFQQDIGDAYPWAFSSMSMSDGTLRVFGALLAIYQMSAPSLIMIEEPEATIHPAALEVLLDILMEGSMSSQVVLTTHSPDLLDNNEIGDDQLRVVASDKGKTEIAHMRHGLREHTKSQLFTIGEMIRVNELAIDETEAKEMSQQLSLFGARKN